MSNYERDPIHPFIDDFQLSAIQKNLADGARSMVGTKRMLDKRYERDPNIGMNPKQGVDCSGLVSLLLDRMEYPRQYDTLNIRYCLDYFDFFGEIYQSERQEGDLIFFSNGWKINHMGIMISPNEYIHTDRKRGIVAVSVLVFEEIVTRGDSSGPYRINPIGFRRLFPLSETEK